MRIVGRILLLSVGLFLFNISPSNAQSVHGVLRVVKGEVKIKSATKNGEIIRARIGEKVFPKDVIVTGKDARAKIVMVDNNEINVSPESQIEIQNYEYDPSQGKKDVILNVIYGKVRSKVEQKYDGRTSKFQIKTPSAVAGVRGTDFITGYDRGTRQSQVITFHGRVEFGLPGPGGSILSAVSVTPGTTASSAGGAAPSAPTAVSKDALAKYDSETRNDSGPKTESPADDNRHPANDKNNNDKNEGDANKPDDSASRRGPASQGPAGSAPGSSGTSMITAGDLPAEGPVLPPVNNLPPPIMPPQMIQPPPCAYCQEVIGTKSTNLIIKVK